MLEFLKRPQQDVRIELPGATIEFNHRTRTVFMYVDNPMPAPDSFDDLAKHFAKRGYTLTVFAPALGQRPPQKP